MTVIISSNDRLTKEEFYVFCKLPNKAFSIKEVSKILKMKETEVSKVIKQLEEKHLVTKY